MIIDNLFRYRKMKEQEEEDDDSSHQQRKKLQQVVGDVAAGIGGATSTGRYLVQRRCLPLCNLIYLSMSAFLGEKPKKPRIRRDGSKPLGRPKKRNPDGSLVHPPKLPKVKTPVLLGSGAGQQQQQQRQQGQTVSNGSRGELFFKTRLMSWKLISLLQAANLISVKKKRRQVMSVSTPGAARQDQRASTPAGQVSSASKEAGATTAKQGQSLGAAGDRAASSPKIIDLTGSSTSSSLTIKKRSSATVTPSLTSTSTLSSAVTVTMTKVRDTPISSSKPETKGLQVKGETNTSFFKKKFYWCEI